MALTVGDFEKQPHGPFLFNRWCANRRALSPLGEWAIELTTSLDDPDPPDGQMVIQAEEIMGLVAKQHSEIVDATYADYQRCRENESWMKARGVPFDLCRTDITDYVKSLTIDVGRRIGSKNVDRAGIQVSVRRDDEHTIRFEAKNGCLRRSD